MADKFVPVSAAYDTATQDAQSARSWQVWIDNDDDGALENVTESVFNNTISGGGSETRAKQYTVRLRNAGGAITVGAYANAMCALAVDVGGEGYATVFTGFVSDKGAQRDRRSGRKDTVVITMQDQRVLKSKHKTTPTIYAAYKIVNTASPSGSLLHALADMMGIASDDVQAVTVDHTKDYVSVYDKKDPWKEIKLLAEAFKAHVTIRYDGDLLFESRFETGWSEPTTEWTLDDEFVHSYKGKSLGVIANRVSANWQEWELLDQRVVYRNTENWDDDTEKCEIALASSAYWPGPLAGDRARLHFKDPDSGEQFSMCTSVQTPSIGAEGSDSDIEYTGGAPTLVSFNGSTSATVANPDKAEIILQAHADGTTITKFEIRGEPLRLVADRTVQRKDGSISNEEDYRDLEIDGKYATSDSQIDGTVQWWLEWGSVARDHYTVRCHFLPQVQEGAVVTFNPHSGLNQACFVESYKHICKGVMGSWSTELVLREKETITKTGNPEIVEENGGGGGRTAYVTKGEHQTGYVHSGSGGTTVPVAPTIDTEQSKGAYKANVIVWDRQLNLTNFSHYGLQVSDDDLVWYELDFNLSTGPLGEASAVTQWAGERIVHPAKASADGAGEPEGRALYYRVRRSTKAAVDSAWSASVQLTTSVIDTGDIAANAVTANKVATTFLESVVVSVRDKITISDTYGFAGFVGVTHKETFTVTESGSALDGEYFLISSPTTDYYVWYDVDGGSDDPLSMAGTHAAVKDRTGVEVDVAAGNAASKIAEKTASAIDALEDFSCADSGVTIPIVSSKQGVTKLAWTIGNTAHSLALVATGTDPSAPGSGDTLLKMDGDEIVLQEYDGVLDDYRDMLRVGGEDEGTGVLKEWFQGRGLRNLDRVTQDQRWPTSTAWYYPWSTDHDPANTQNWDDNTSYKTTAHGALVSTPVKFGTHAYQVHTTNDDEWSIGQTGFEDCYMACWVYFPDHAEADGFLIQFRQDGDNRIGIHVDSGDFFLRVEKGNTTVTATIADLGGGALLKDTWYFIGFVWDEGNNKAYLVANDQVVDITNTASWGSAANVAPLVTAQDEPRPVIDDFIFDIRPGADINPWLLVMHYLSGLPWNPDNAGPIDVEVDADSHIVARAPLRLMHGLRENPRAIGRDFTFADDGPSTIVCGGARTITLPDAASNRGRWIRIFNDDNQVVTINRAGSDVINTPAGHSDITSVELWSDGEVFQAIAMLDEDNVSCWFTIPQYVVIEEDARTNTPILSFGSSTADATVSFNPHVPPGATQVWALCRFFTDNRQGYLDAFYNAVDGAGAGWENALNSFYNETNEGYEVGYVATWELEDDRDATYRVAHANNSLTVYEPMAYMRV